MKLEVSTQLKYPFSRNPSPGELLVMNCPRCGSPISTPPEREWNFQKYRVSRFRCDNGDKFNLYAGATKGHLRYRDLRTSKVSVKTVRPRIRTTQYIARIAGQN